MSTSKLGRRTAILMGLLLAPVAVATVLYTTAQAQETQTRVTVKGKIEGGQTLMNPVWLEAAMPQSHRYTFRQRSSTVGADAKRLTADLPREVAVVALGSGAPAATAPVQVHVSGGRTTPVTIVIGAGQQVQFVNDDPFPHKLYDTGKIKDGLGAEDIKPGGQRVWKPPAAGVYEIHDELFPSVRSWVVVEPKAVAVGRITIKNEFVVRGLLAGTYELQAYHNGKKVGTALPIEVRTVPEQQEIRDALVVGKAAGKEGDKDDDVTDVAPVKDQ